MKLHTKYQGSRPCGFRQEDVSRFPYINLSKTFDPCGQAIFSRRGIIKKKLGRGLLGYVTYPNTKALGLVVSDKKIFSCFHYRSLCKTCDPGMGPFLTPGAYFEPTW